jgi:hypothetical protein
MGSSSILARAGAGSSFEVSFIDEIGVRRREPLPTAARPVATKEWPWRANISETPPRERR